MADVAFWGLSLVAVAGALVVVFARGVMRMAGGLAAFLLAVAGFFAAYGMAFLAVAQVFVYVGGVLVLMLFAIAVIRRDEEGHGTLGSRLDGTALLISAITFWGLTYMLRGTTNGLEAVDVGAEPLKALADNLLGGSLVHFELLGLLLLFALVAVVSIMAGKDGS